MVITGTRSGRPGAKDSANQSRWGTCPKARTLCSRSRVRKLGRCLNSFGFNAYYLSDGLGTGLVPADLGLRCTRKPPLSRVSQTSKHAMIDARTGIAIDIASPNNAAGFNIVINPESRLVIRNLAVVLKE